MELLDNIDKVHTTDMGVDRIKRNIEVDVEDIVEYCVEKINQEKSINSVDSVTIYPYSDFLTLNDCVASEHFGKQKYLQLYEDVVNIENYLTNPITIFRDYNQLLIELQLYHYFHHHYSKYH